MGNKKGFLLAEETLKLIIAVIAIGFLVYLLVALYFSFKTSPELEQAKSSLDFLSSQINSGKERVDIYNPKGWYLITWKYITESPKTCSNSGFEKCICICEENTLDSCDSNGVCLNNPQGFQIVGDSAIEGKIKITNPPITLNIDKANKEIRILTEEAGGGFGGGGGGGF